MEIEYGGFQRRIELGVDIDPTNVTANYDKGMLRVHLPLAPQRREEKVNIEVRRLDGAPDAEAPRT
jgi:HSP20 family molecular chaperone IbpA